MGRRMRHLEELSFESLFGEARPRRTADAFFAELAGEDDPSADEDTPTTVVVVGQRVELDVRKVFASGAIESIEWTIPGTSVGDYQPKPDGATVTAVDRKQNPLRFYWLDGGDGRVVSCRVVVKVLTARIETELRFAFDVKAPQLKLLRGKTSQPKILSVSTTSGPGHRISFGEHGGTPGIEWEWEVKLPATHGGQLMDLQLVKLGRRKTRRASASSSNETMVRRAKGGGDRYILDVGDDECPPPKVQYAVLLKGAAGATVQTELPFDSPSDHLEKIDWAYEVDENFTYYVLYKPDFSDAIWVPVGMAKWFWCAGAQKYHGVWKLRSTPKPHGKVGAGRATTELPQYSGNTCEQQWCTLDDAGVLQC